MRFIHTADFSFNFLSLSLISQSCCNCRFQGSKEPNSGLLLKRVVEQGTVTVVNLAVIRYKANVKSSSEFNTTSATSFQQHLLKIGSYVI